MILIDTFNCTIETLSPVHIGSGKSYGSSEYFFDNLTTKKGKRIDIIKRVNVDKYFSSLSKDKQDDFIEGLTTPHFKLESFDFKIKKKNVRYRSYNKCKNSPNEIQEHIKTMDELYIPGSSLKGAIKTALLSEALTSSEIEKITTERYGETRINFKALDSFFSSNPRNFAQTSIMRFFKVSDSSSIKNSSVHDIVTLKAQEFGGYEFHKKPKIVYIFLETIGRGQTLNCKFNLNFDKVILNKLRISEKMENLDIDYIKNSIHNFSREFIDYERNFADEYDIKTLKKFYKRIDGENSYDEPLIKLGGGSGFMATTIGMKVKNNDFPTFELIRNTFKRKYKYEFPKSRKITVKGGLPLGWVKLKFDEVKK